MESETWKTSSELVSERTSHLIELSSHAGS